MKKIICRKISVFLFFIFLFTAKISAQHFIYIQSDKMQQYAVSVNDKVYNSSSVGHVIIPKLQDSQYQITISFPQDIYPKQNFICVVNKKDIGFELKNFDKGWGLFNIETLEVIYPGDMPKNTSAQVTPAQDQPKTNAFGEMLGDVVNDSTLNKKPVVQTQMPAANVPVATINTVSQMPGVAANNIIETSAKGIIKASEQSADNGTSMMFVDFNNSKSDTINIFIPSDAASENKPATQNAASIPETINSVSLNSKTDSSAASNNPFYNHTDNNTTSVSSNDVNTAPSSTSNNTASNYSFKSDCLKMATDEDLDKARKKMAKETDASAMVVDAKKSLAGKCVTTLQVKTIGALFLSDEARYNFYEAMYSFAYDYGNYPSLESQLIDSYYKNRFHALLH